METLIKLVILVFFVASSTYRSRCLWQDLEEFYNINVHLLPNLKTVDSIYKLFSWLNTFLVVWSAYIFMSQPLYYLSTIIGLVVYIFGLTVAISARYSIGRSWANVCEVVEVGPLVEVGLYSYCRNPIYFGLGIEWIGFILNCGWQAGSEVSYVTLAAVIAIGFMSLTHKIVLEEEKFLVGRFGNEYLQYCQNTPRYFPLPNLKKLFKRDTVL